MQLLWLKRKCRGRISRVPSSSSVEGLKWGPCGWENRDEEYSGFSCPKGIIYSFWQTLLIVLIDNELISPILYSAFYRIEVLGTAKTSDKHGSKATLAFPFFIYGLFSLLSSLGFVSFFLQGSFSTYKLVRAWKRQNHPNRWGKNSQCTFYFIFELTTGDS